MPRTFGKKTLQTLPFVSVVVPAYNEAENIATTIKTIEEQDYAGSFEVIIVDNNSSDSTGDIAEKLGCKVILERQKGTRFAYQAGMSAATSEYILVTNADTKLPKDWISKLINYYLEHPDVVGIGTRITFYDAPGWVNIILYLLNFTLNPVPAFWGPSMSVRRSAFIKVGGINHGYDQNEDAIFSLLLRKVGKVKILRNIVVGTSGRRFQGGPWIAIQNWATGYGLNSIYIQFEYLLFARVKGWAVSFKDVRRPHNKENN